MHFRELLPGRALLFNCLRLDKAQRHPVAKQQAILGAIATDDSMEARSHEWRVLGQQASSRLGKQSFQRPGAVSKVLHTRAHQLSLREP